MLSLGKAPRRRAGWEESCLRVSATPNHQRGSRRYDELDSGCVITVEVVVVPPISHRPDTELGVVARRWSPLLLKERGQRPVLGEQGKQWDDYHCC